MTPVPILPVLGMHYESGSQITTAIYEPSMFNGHPVRGYHISGTSLTFKATHK